MLRIVKTVISCDILFEHEEGLLRCVKCLNQIYNAWVVKLRHYGDLSLQQFMLPLVHFLLSDDFDGVFLFGCLKQ